MLASLDSPRAHLYPYSTARQKSAAPLGGQARGEIRRPHTGKDATGRIATHVFGLYWCVVGANNINRTVWKKHAPHLANTSRIEFGLCRQHFLDDAKDARSIRERNNVLLWGRPCSV